MFGFSFGEILVLVIVGIVVVGPRKLPEMMRTVGGWIAKIRRMSTDLRAQSGIDDLIRQEGLERELRELRSLSRVNMIETLVTPVSGAAAGGSVVSARPKLAARPVQAPTGELEDDEPPEPPLREREYPALGCDSYGAYPDDAVLYTGEVYNMPADADADADNANANAANAAAAEPEAQLPQASAEGGAS